MLATGVGDSGPHLAVLKGQIAVYHLAVNELQPLAVAQGLGADDGAVVKGHVLAVPGQVLPFTVQLRTTTFFACQKASLVSKEQCSNREFSMYWKEYFP